MKPGVSILVSTFARTATLRETVECFRRCTYDGPLEMVVVNDCDKQTLRCNVPGVVVHNLPLFPSIADKFNWLFAQARHELLIRCDDDDLLLPDAVSLLVQKLEYIQQRSGEPSCATRFRRVLVWDERQMRACSSAAHHGAIIRRTAWEQSGGYVHVAGEYPDRPFWERASKTWLRGGWHYEPDGHLQYIYRKGGISTHRQQETSFRHSQLALIDMGYEPAGGILIEPSWSQDWQALSERVKLP